jgi:hypothetical protein
VANLSQESRQGLGFCRFLRRPNHCVLSQPQHCLFKWQGQIGPLALERRFPNGRHKSGQQASRSLRDLRDANLLPQMLRSYFKGGTSPPGGWRTAQALMASLTNGRNVGTKSENNSQRLSSSDPRSWRCGILFSGGCHSPPTVMSIRN